jgi:peptidoglycan/xylan/chitin deacetylase (PgdA/CDA1 family)
MPICITFDTESYGYEGKNFSMLERAIPRILEIGEKYDIPYTFFLCGEVAENCRALFSNLKRHKIGVHTHPFTHVETFKGESPNDYRQDLLEKYSGDHQYQMIFKDLQMITDNLAVKPKVFRAGKYSANYDTFTVLEKLGIEVDCSRHPSFQIIGWQPYKIRGTSVWEIPTYCDFSPETVSYLTKLFKTSAIAHSFMHSVYIGTIHPMIFGNPMVDNMVYFKRYEEMIKSMLEMGFNFLTVEQALEQAKRTNIAYNTIGRIFSAAISPVQWIIRKVI